ncbi:MAG TPA: carboxypeptidase-like regulatory domain-containing protein [Streptosporangiaceae bacterium]|nr:carboxypeptidase-like regulatory domain-containing protein [Streptosporangiaceae bacterium]
MTRAHCARAIRILAISTIILAGLATGLAPSAGAAVQARPPAARHPAAQHSAPQSAAAASVGALTGIVLGAGQVPLGRACVTVTSTAGMRAARTVLTDSAGRYIVEGLVPGSYTIGFSDCSDPAGYFHEWYGRSFTPAGAEHVTVLSGRSIALGPVDLRPTDPQTAIAAQQRALREHPRQVSTNAPTISGTVFSPAGRRLSGICVTAWANVPGGQSGVGVSTSRRGTYRFGPDTGGLPGTKVTVQFTTGCGNNGNYAPQWWKHSASEAKATTLSVPAGTHLTGIDAKLRVGGEIAGTVHGGSARGPVLHGICVQAVGTGGDPDFASATTGRNGAYLLKGLGTGRYQLTFSTGCGNHGNYLDQTKAARVTAGRKTTGVDAILRPGGEITGTVTTSGTSTAPIAGICVTAESRSGFGEGVTSANGSYTLRQVPPGRFVVSFSGGCGNSGSYAPQYYPGQVSPESAAIVRIGLGQTRTGIDASMAVGATITGRVTNILGHGLRGVCLVLQSPQNLGGFGPSLLDLILAGQFGSAVVGTNSAGRYSIPNLAPGPYYAQFFSCGNANLAAQWYSAAPHLTTASLISADAGAVTTGINAVMRTGGAITGTVRGKGGRLLRAFCPVALDPTEPASLGLAIIITIPAPNMHGHYRITGLSTGSYKVEFLPCYGGHYAIQWYRGKASEGSATPVRVTAGHVTAGINAALHAGQSVSGTVTSQTGRRLANVCVIATDRRGSPVGFALTNRHGRYLIGEVPSGIYTLRFAECTQASPTLAPVAKTGVRVGTSRPTTGVNAVLGDGGFIDGTVLAGAEGGGSPVPAAGICVEATPRTGEGIGSTAVTNAAGRYSLTGLAAGKYSLLFTADCITGTQAVVPQRYPRLIQAGPDSAVAGVDATLQQDGQITGTVDGPGAQPLGGICVTAQPTTAGVAPVVAVTTSTGSYAIDSLLPGSYRVTFSAACGITGYATQWYDDAPSAAGATPVPVSAGKATVSIDAVMTP